MAVAVIKEVEATRSILEEIASCQADAIRTLPVELNDIGIEWVAMEIFVKLDTTAQTLSGFTAMFREEVVQGSERVRSHWKYCSTNGPGHIGVIVMPEDRNSYFDIIPDSTGKKIKKYRYWSFR